MTIKELCIDKRVSLCSLSPTTQDEVEQIILSLKNKPCVGWDKVSTKLIKSTLHIISVSVMEFFTISSNTPIDINNYRQVSTLSNFLKYFKENQD